MTMIGTASPTKKTRIVRVRRNSLGVEIGRSYDDVPPEMIHNTNDTIMNKPDERTPFLPLKPSSIQRRRSSIDTASISNSYEQNTDIMLDSKMASLASPTKKKIVRVRRSSLGVEIERTYADVSSKDDSSNSTTGSENLPVSPSKTRFVRVHRNSEGVEIGRSYVDAPKTKQDITVVNPITRDHDTTTSVQLSPVPHVGQLKSSMISPSKITSPSKVASLRMKSLSRTEDMKAMELSSSDVNSFNLFVPTIGQDGNVDLQKKNGRIGGVPQVSPNTAAKVKSLKARQAAKTADVGSNHFVTTPSARSRSMRMYPGADNSSSTDDYQAQSLRLLRVLLGEDGATMTKENVDKALEKHAELLRYQLQQKKKIKQRDETIQQEKKQQEEMIEEHKKQILKLNDDVQKQKLLMKTSLEIKDVEIGILTKESEQKSVKIQQLGWRLAKERAAAKESKSTDGAIVSVSQNSDGKEDSNSFLDLLNIPPQSSEIDDDDLSEATPLAGHTSFSNVPSPSKTSKSTTRDREDGESLSPTKMSQLKKKLDQTEGQLLVAKKSILELEKKQQEMELDFEETLHESKAKVTQLKAVLTACNERRRVAEQMLRDLGKFDEAMLIKISRKPPNELMNDISERGISMKVGALTTSESENSSSLKTPSTGSALEKEVESLELQLNEAKSRSFKLEVDNEMNEKQVQAVKEENAKLESQLMDLQLKLKDCEVQLAVARNTEKLRASSASLREIEKATTECYEMYKVKMESELKDMQVELEKARQNCTNLQLELSNKAEESYVTIKATEERISTLETKMLQAVNDKEKAERDMEQHQVELEEARLLLQQSEAMIQKYATRLQETNAAMKQCEEKIQELNSRIECQQTESVGNMASPSVEEIHSMLIETQAQVKEYETKLGQVQLALNESEAMAEKYLLMLDEANATLEQSEKLMRQYDSMQPNLLLNGSGPADGSEFTGSSGGTESEGSDDLSMKSAQDLLAYASKRLYGVPASAQSGDDTSNVADDDISNIQSNVGKNTLMRKWEKSGRQNASISKIATLETELAERQIQLNDALHKIADLTRNSGAATTTSGTTGHHSDDTELTKALAQVTELKERIAMTEAKYHEATKKLIFLKETVLTVVDTEMSILK